MKIKGNQKERNIFFIDEILHLKPFQDGVQNIKFKV